MAKVYRYNEDRPTTYDIFDLDESMLMTIVVGLRDQIKKYEADLKRWKFRGQEDQEFLRGQIDEINEFIAKTEKFVVVTDTGFVIK